MVLPVKSLPFGLREVQLRAIDDAGVVSAVLVKLPVARTFSFAETEDYETLEGDDVQQGSHGKGPIVEWELEGGGISLEAYAAMAGGTVTVSGTGATEKKTYKKNTSQSRPYFQVEGRAISDSGGDFHTLVYRCKAEGNFEGEMAYGTFLLTKASGKGYGDATGQLYDHVQNATPTAIA